MLKVISDSMRKVNEFVDNWTQNISGRRLGDDLQVDLVRHLLGSNVRIHPLARHRILRGTIVLPRSEKLTYTTIENQSFESALRKKPSTVFHESKGNKNAF